MANARKKEVPEILWRVYGSRARTLATTVASLVPPLQPDSSCRCDGRSCLSCCGDAISFLLRPGDPQYYRKLLNGSFVVVNDDAPPLLHCHPAQRWPLRQIVATTIEMIQFQKRMSSNVLCSGYDKYKRTSPVVQLLNSSAWALLLERVGDEFMIYLLRNTSIFLPSECDHKKHHQVAGPPIRSLCFNLSKRAPKPQYGHPSLVYLGPGKKRKRIDNINSVSKMQKLDSLFNVAAPLSSACCLSSSVESQLRPVSSHHGNICSQVSSTEAAERNGATARCKADSSDEVQQRPNQIVVELRKQSRPFRWQRRQLIFQECIDKSSYINSLSDDGSSSGRLSCNSNNHSGRFQMPIQCCCHLIFKCPQLASHGTEIDRKSMFYNLERSSSVLPQKHMLNMLKPNILSSKSLLEHIFCLSHASAKSIPCSHDNGFSPPESACLYHSLSKMMKMLIRRSHDCQYLRLLDKHCAVPSSDEKVTILESNDPSKAGDTQFKSTMPYCSKGQVVSFIWAVCKSIVPPDLLGAPSNWRALRRNISKFIGLRRFEKFSVRQCMHKLQTSNLPFFSNKHTSCYLESQVPKDAVAQNVGFSRVNDIVHNLKHKLLVNWIFWFFKCLVVPLVQANFYVTESEHGKQDLFYYRKSVWEKLKDRAITCFKEKSYCQLDEAAVRDIISNRSFGFSKLRFCPKQNGVRMLSNLKASSIMPIRGHSLNYRCSGMPTNAQPCHRKVKFERFESVNSSLRETHAVLRGLQLKEPGNLGSSVFDYNDVYKKLCPFLAVLKNGSRDLPGVFIIVSDVSKAFDSIIQDKLLEVMRHVIKRDEYLLQQCYQVICTKKYLWVHENLILNDQNINVGYTSFKPSVLFGSLHGILVQGCSRFVNKEELFFYLDEHVKHNVLQIDKVFYLQSMGIPQGSVLSSMLCSLYYGHMERNLILPFLEKACKPETEDISTRLGFIDTTTGHNLNKDAVNSTSSYLLLRLIDDFLFITTSKKQATSFFYRLKRGFPDFNCYMNEDKFGLNFDIGHESSLLSNKLYVSEDGVSYLRWSGLLINCCTLEVQGDYTRYLNNHLSSTLTVHWRSRPVYHLKRKLGGFIAPKCHPLFLDENINSAAVIRLNIYQAFLLCAMKVHCYIYELSYIHKLRTTFYLKIIERSLRYMHMLIRRRMRSICLDSDSSLRPILKLQKREVEWLGLNAYIEVFERKQSRYKALLSVLRSKYFELKINVSPELEFAIERSHSSILWKIKY